MRFKSLKTTFIGCVIKSRMPYFHGRRLILWWWKRVQNYVLINLRYTGCLYVLLSVEQFVQRSKTYIFNIISGDIFNINLFTVAYVKNKTWWYWSFVFYYCNREQSNCIMRVNNIRLWTYLFKYRIKLCKNVCNKLYATKRSRGL